ncbi:hypothetical protein JHD46_02635 [Sulfurimonas sp. SAG-AH-194-C20]|nr:hypothetical protein [Sulfurimonas sp. SAG-AH-194-C20]MDF1878533.1 hypothetical protein [Sulfurimonas sp. SAG-AH-194-C20]
MIQEENREYHERMIEAFINKPEVTLWYQMAFSKFNINGVDNLTWNWSWWAFGGSFLFLLYRKAYIAAFALFFLSMTLGMIPFVSLIFMILSGGYSTYFVYKVYRTKLQEVEEAIEDVQTRVETMRELGGYNQWVVWVYAVFISFVFAGIFLTIIPFLSAS